MSKETVQGVTRFYGERDVDLQEELELKSLDDIKPIEVDFDCTDLPVVADGVVIGNAGDVIVGARVEVLTPLDSSGNNATLTIGLRDADNNAIDDDGIDAAIAEADLDTAGKQVVCDGAM